MAQSVIAQSKVDSLLIWSDTEVNTQEHPQKLIIYIPENLLSDKMVLICPGGGYSRQAPHEAKPVAEYLNSKGIAAAVLYYHTGKSANLAYDDAVQAIKILKSRASALGYKAEKVCIMGFSAGGHLAGLVATQPNLPLTLKSKSFDSYNASVNRLVLAYAVVSFAEFAHKGSAKNFLGTQYDNQAIKRKYSNHLNVSAHTPPTFVFHTKDDAGVPVQNAYLFEQACKQNGIACEMAIFENGKHGVGLAKDNPTLSVWPALLVNWLLKE